MFVSLLKYDGIGMPTWAFIVLAVPAMGGAVYGIYLFVKDKFGTK
jgi:hypothetical protein